MKCPVSACRSSAAASQVGPTRAGQRRRARPAARMVMRRTPPATGDGSWLCALEDLGRVAREGRLGLGDGARGGGSARCGVDVQALDALVPAAELVHLRLLLVELGQGEL